MHAAIVYLLWAAVSFAVAHPTLIVPDTKGSRLSSNPNLPRVAPPIKGLHSSEGALHELVADERGRYADQAIILQRRA